MFKKIKGKVRDFLPEKWPNRSQYSQIFSILEKREKRLFLGALILFVVSFATISFSFYYNNTVPIPAFGGRYIEGMIGYPQFLNPLYSSVNDVDRDIVEILFSGIIKYNSSGEAVPWLAENISIKENIYEVTLREGLKWSDGNPITADDIVFTVELIQNPKTRSPLRADWAGVRVEKISDLAVSFRLERESLVFLDNLSLKPIPSHIWKDIPVQNITFSRYNLEPVGSGPYKIKEVKKREEGAIELITLEPNSHYHNQKPNIREISFVFLKDAESLAAAAKKREISGFSSVSPKEYREIAESGRFVEHGFYLPRYFGLFFNLKKSEILGELDVRKALNHGINKEEVIDGILAGKGYAVNSPMLSEVYGFGPEVTHDFDPDKAVEIFGDLGFKKEGDTLVRVIREERVFEFKSDLKVGSQGEEVRELQRCLIETGGFTEGEVTGFYGTDTRDAVSEFQEKYREEILSPGGFNRGTGMVSKLTRNKLNDLCGVVPESTTNLVLRIATVDQPLMADTAKAVKEQWEKLGVRTEIDLFDIGTLERDVIKPREYEILLFGKAFRSIPDPFPFWHSSQKTEHGLNLSMYSSEDLDDLLERIRYETNVAARQGLLAEFQEMVVENVPVIPLFNPQYTLFASGDIKGISGEGITITPSHRFANIENWYIETKRVRK